ncbi:MAG: hypothetical protein PHE83_07620 [Opitutaceae bacterium]|nr:hypothetical protein [Opitutaceae bacterium]
MTPDNLEDLLRRRDELTAVGDGIPVLEVDQAIENEEIRELGRIVLETTAEEAVAYSTT